MELGGDYVFAKMLITIFTQKKRAILEIRTHGPWTAGLSQTNAKIDRQPYKLKAFQMLTLIYTQYTIHTYILI